MDSIVGSAGASTLTTGVDSAASNGGSSNALGSKVTRSKAAPSSAGVISTAGRSNVGQFAGGGQTQSSGFIAAYDLATGKLDGLLEDASGKPLAINGIWSLSPGNVSPANNDPATAPAAAVYFTAGPNHGSGGLLGHLTAVSSELATGNDQ